MLSTILKLNSARTHIYCDTKGLTNQQVDLAVYDGFSWRDKRNAKNSNGEPERYLLAPLSYRNIVKIKKIVPDIRMDADVQHYYETQKKYIREHVIPAQKYRTAPMEEIMPEFEEMGFQFPDWVRHIDVQIRAILWLKHVKRTTLELRVGHGKTFVSLCLLDWLKRTEGRQKILICAPHLLIKYAWIADIKKFGFNLTYDILPNRKEAKVFFSRSDIDIFLVSNGLLPYIKKDLSRQYFDVVIVDEASVLKSISNKSFQAIKATKCDRLILQSASIAPNSIEEFFAPMYLIGNVLGNTLSEFRAKYQYAVKDKNDPKRILFWVDTKAGIARVREIMKYWRFISTDKDIEGMPERVSMARYFDLSSKQLKHYKELEKDYITFIESHKDELKHNVPVIVKSELTLRNKLLQCINGFLIDAQGETIPIFKKVEDSPKYKLLYEIVEKIMTQGDDSIIIWGVYQEEIDAAKRMLKKFKPVTAYGKDTKARKQKNIDKFLSGESRIIIAHPKSVKFGHTWNHARYMIWMSATESYEDFYQGRGRNQRIGSKFDTIFEIKLISTGTVEEKIYKVIEKKENLAKILERG